MLLVRSWRALFGREYLEHRIPFLYVPLGILGLLVASAASALGFNRVKLVIGFAMPSALKLFEFGYFVLIALWFAYLGVTLFFYFGDAFSADRRNNAMFFWKSMPVSDFRMMATKFVAGALMFPLILLAVIAVSGLLHYLVIDIATLLIPGLAMPDPLAVLASFVQITLFAAFYMGLALLWYAPFLAWVGGLSTVFGRWSLPLALVIPGLISVVENIVFFGNGPRGGYVWAYLSHRWQFGLNDMDYGLLFISPLPFDAGLFVQRVIHETDWISLAAGLVFATGAIWLASEYRRRRIA